MPRPRKRQPSSPYPPTDPRTGGDMNFASDNAAGIAPEILAAIARANAGAALAYGQDAWTSGGSSAICRAVRARGRGVPGGDRHRRQCAGARASDAAMGRGAVPCRVAYRDRRMRRAGIFRRRHQARRAWPARPARSRPRHCTRDRAGQWGGPHHVSATVLSLSQATEAGTIYRPAEIARSPRSRMRTGSPCMSTARASATRSRA